MNDATASNTPIIPAASAPSTPANPAAVFAAAPVSTVTPGWRTSEFWMTALGQLGLVLAAASGALPTRYAAIAGALSQVAYNVSRGMVKSSAAAA